MISANLMGLVFSFAGAPSDSALEHIRSEQVRIADSVWTDRQFYVEASLYSGAAFGSLLDEEQEFAKNVGFVVSRSSSMSDAENARISIMTTGLGIGLWNRFSSEADLGLGYRYHMESIRTQLPGKSEIVLNAHEALLRGRYWVFRRLNFQVGPQIGWGWTWGTLNRYQLEQDVKMQDPNADPATLDRFNTYLRKANQALSVNGTVVELGAVMNVRITPSFLVGGGIVVDRRKLDLASNDPLIGWVPTYPNTLKNWDVSLQLQAAVRF